jgi:hypothetical protein
MGKLGKTPGGKKAAQQIDLPRLFRLLLSEEKELKSNICLFSYMNNTLSKGGHKAWSETVYIGFMLLVWISNCVHMPKNLCNIFCVA